MVDFKEKIVEVEWSARKFSNQEESIGQGTEVKYRGTGGVLEAF